MVRVGCARVRRDRGHASSASGRGSRGGDRVSRDARGGAREFAIETAFDCAGDSLSIELNLPWQFTLRGISV